MDTELNESQANEILGKWGVDAKLPAKGEKLCINLPPNKSGFVFAEFTRKNKALFVLTLATKEEMVPA